ncbi:MAG: cytochrome C oxidase subunit I [Bacteroidia bacterium]
MLIAGSNSPIKNTSYKVVIPFYGYASLSFLLATILIMQNTLLFTQHYFNPPTLAITHIMALGWGTMMILGASHQLFPVLIEGKLYSDLLANLSFYFAAIGIPLLVYSFYNFDMGIVAQTGAILINLSVLCYIVNLTISISQSKKENVHAMFAITAAFWLLLTTGLGLLLVYNFTHDLLSKNSIHYLSFHAHMGIIGWFLLMVIGVGSRLIPMFLISKYENAKRLWWAYALINIGLIGFVFIFISSAKSEISILSIILIGIGVLLFALNIYQSYTDRIRKKVDEQVKTSMLSVAFMIIPLIVLIGILITLASIGNMKFVLLYGFTIFFGWVTAIILGMTFKTLPFIIWNKVYSKIAGLGKTPNPKELFNNNVYIVSGITYVIGFVMLSFGIIITNVIVLNIGAALLLITALLYNLNVFKILLHKAK